MEFNHVSVLLEECIEGLCIKPDGIYVDGTLGGAGHGYEVCRRLSEKGRFVGIDQDEDALRASAERLREFGSRAAVVKSNYTYIKEVLKEQKIDGVDGILLDLGVSSYQLDTEERGFSYMADAPLDMRMDRSQQMTARDLVNGYEEEKLYQVIKVYGEERFARSIARNIVRRRKEKEIETTGELVDVIRHSMPAKAKNGKGHPAKRTFQAIRIELNRELEVLQDSLEDMVSVLNDGGRLCIITFHSLEDRIVKNQFRNMENPCTCPPDFPVCVCGKVPQGKVITRKPILPGEEEIKKNKRSKSAKLRIFEKEVGRI
ncbi:MAG: 16S rRNA (cytosine(1402)-N(4))-methyltransferase RsmH [Roseburia sp.]|nr:16S rRNA (cytosine(1402)-N(4))-methyltransferase RsmH [Roseburia sp.]